MIINDSRNILEHLLTLSLKGIKLFGCFFLFVGGELLNGFRFRVVSTPRYAVIIFIF